MSWVSVDPDAAHEHVEYTGLVTPSFQMALVDTRPVAMRWHSKNVDGWSFLGVELAMAPGTTKPVYSTCSCAASGSTETQLIGWR